MDHEKETDRKEVQIPTEEEVIAFLKQVGQAEGNPVQVIETIRQGLQERRYEDYDYLGLLKHPIPAMLPGGYLAFREPNGSYGQIDSFGMDRRARAAARPDPLSRRYRAMFRAGDAWQESAP